MSNNKSVTKIIDGVKMEIKKSSKPEKKYQATFTNPKTGNKNTIFFGASNYSKFKDSTGLGLYSHKDHLDKNRRDRYYKRHGTNYKSLSPGQLSAKFLW